MGLSLKGEAAWETGKTFLRSMVLMFYSFVFDIESLYTIFLCSPTFHKSWDEISLRGRAITPYVMERLIKLIK
jgi:hypothetical protein